ncbi:MAG TPA: KEOPS complex subunit Pcc1 [Methanocella sp.]|nr:KEOPS complex subunit Pcc1 [Methanocella sp.]
MAKCRARMVVEAEDPCLLERAIAADNAGYVRTRVEDGRLVALVEADSTGSLLATLDDLLVSLKVADQILSGRGTIEGQED